MLHGMTLNRLHPIPPRMRNQPPNSKWLEIQWLVQDTEIVMDQSKMSKPVGRAETKKQQQQKLVSIKFSVPWHKEYANFLKLIFSQTSSDEPKIIMKNKIRNYKSEAATSHDIRSFQST